MRILAALIAVLPMGLATPVANAVPKAGAKTPPACGAKILPLVTGNSWTYIPGVPKDAILPELVKIAPRQPQKVVITVKSVEAKGTETLAKLEEKVTYEITPENKEKKKPAVLSEVTVASTITCSKTKFEISPESFFFSGEPGGYRELTFDKLDRSKDTSFKLTNGTFGDAPWREDVVAHFTRQPTKEANAKMSGGKLELERSFTPERSEPVVTKSGTRYEKAEKLALLTTGRVIFDAPVSPTPAPSELPKGWYTRYWFEPGVGIVQTLNMYAHMYQLSESTLN
ncbi:MAG: hypothetical protein ABI867_18420 [Kofleriaceae bacterium]